MLCAFCRSTRQRPGRQHAQSAASFVVGRVHKQHPEKECRPEARDAAPGSPRSLVSLSKAALAGPSSPRIRCGLRLHTRPHARRCANGRCTLRLGHGIARLTRGIERRPGSELYFRRGFRRFAFKLTPPSPPRVDSGANSSADGAAPLRGSARACRATSPMSRRWANTAL